MTDGRGVEEAVRYPARPTDLLEVVRVLLLLQGGILVANTLEAGLFAVAFSGGLTPTALATGAAALAIFVGRARLDAHGRGRRPIYIVEAALMLTLAIDMALAMLLTHGSVPIVAIVTRFLMPFGVITLLGRTTRAARQVTMLDVAA